MKVPGINDEDLVGLKKISPTNLTLEVQTGEDNRIFPDDCEAPTEANSKDFERRVQHRKKPPKAAGSAQLQRYLNAIVYKIHGSRIHQLLFALVTLAGLALIWFSASQRLVLIDATYQDFSTKGELETQILQLNEAWSEEEKQDLAAGLAKAEKRSVFNDYQNLAIWLRDHGQHAEELDLNFMYTLGTGQKSLIEGMVEVPVKLELTPNLPESHEVYNQVVEFLRGMVTTAWHVDIQGASIEAQSNGPLTVTVQLRVWVYARIKNDD